MEEKARLLRQKNELSNLMKTVENNIEPKRFKSAVGKSGGGPEIFDELQDFDSNLPPDKPEKAGEKAATSATTNQSSAKS